MIQQRNKVILHPSGQLITIGKASSISVDSPIVVNKGNCGMDITHGKNVIKVGDRVINLPGSQVNSDIGIKTGGCPSHDFVWVKYIDNLTFDYRAIYPNILAIEVVRGVRKWVRGQYAVLNAVNSGGSVRLCFESVDWSARYTMDHKAICYESDCSNDCYFGIGCPDTIVNGTEEIRVYLQSIVGRYEVDKEFLQIQIEWIGEYVSREDAEAMIALNGRKLDIFQDHPEPGVDLEDYQITQNFEIVDGPPIPIIGSNSCPTPCDSSVECSSPSEGSGGGGQS